MAHFDLPLADLRRYRRTPSVPADLTGFWTRTLDEARAAAGPPRVERADTPLRLVDTYDVTFSGFAGQPVKAWLTVPRDADGPRATVVEFIGYGGGRGRPHEWLMWPAAGYAYLVMDTRGQGSSWRAGDTPDPDPDGAGPAVPGYLTRGILDPHTYYYRRLITDAVRAVESVPDLPGTDPARVAVVGTSQGGGLALAAGSLAAARVRAVVAKVPFLCDVRRAVTITDAFPYAELARFCRIHPDRAATAFATIDHVDAVNLVPLATAPALFSAALMDTICPPSTVFGAFNEYGGSHKDIAVYEYDDHDGGRAHFDERSMHFLAETLS